MSLNGKLEDVALADVMQFIHLGRRTGTLSLARGQQEAEIGFHRGQIVSARSPGSRKLGDLLVEEGLIGRVALQELLREQSSDQPRRSLGQMVVSQGHLDFDTLREVLEKQVEKVIFELVTWTSGSFEFALDELKPIDEIAMYPGDVIPKLDLNTQALLLDASRQLDEQNRDTTPVELSAGEAEAEEDQRPISQAMSLGSVADTLEGLEVDIPLEDDMLPEPAHRRLQIVSSDQRFADAVSEKVRPEDARVVRVPLREAGTRLPGEPTPTVVVLDMRDGGHSVEDLLAIRRSRPRSSVIALIDSQEMTTRAFASGAVAAIQADADALAACFHSLIRTIQDARGGSSQTGVRAGFARLRRVLADIRSGLLSATMALNLMHIISESVERAVLFLVRQDGLAAIGAFGFGANNRPLAEVTRGLKISLSSDNVLAHCVADGQPRSMNFDQGRLPPEFVQIIGRPKSGQIVVFPVLGSERVISVVYTDNGPNQHAIEDIELLELATAQVGVAFENELLRRQIGSR